MININFNVRVPQSNKFQNIKHWCRPAFIKHKYFDIQLYKSSDILDFGIDVTHKQDHAGVRISLGLFGYNFEIQVYDSRHWNTVKNQWEEY